MSRVEEIARVIEQLPPDQLAELARWFEELQQKRWDEQLDCDAAAGRLDFLRDEAEAEEESRRLKDWP
jgi:hypothetical protein